MQPYDAAANLTGARSFNAPSFLLRASLCFVPARFGSHGKIGRKRSASVTDYSYFFRRAFYRMGALFFLCIVCPSNPAL